LSLLAAGGLMLARLTRPRAKIVFSESAVMAPYEGGRGLMFRMVNARKSELSDVRVQMSLIWFEEFNGQRERNFHRLELERDSVEFFTLHWTVVHPINAASPLRGVTPEKLREAEAEIVISVSAHEETFSTRVMARSSYIWDEVRWDVKFASIFTSAPDGVIAIDVDRLSRTDRLDEGATRVPAAAELGEQGLRLQS
jgi:inward rectifier potassium channel